MDIAVDRASVASKRMPTLRALAYDALLDCHGELLAARQTVLESRDAAGIHGTRVALRRMRAAASLFGRALADDTIMVLGADAKRLADACGATRDLDVFLAGVMADAESLLAAREDCVAELRAFRATALRLRRGRHNTVRKVLTGELFAVFDARVTGLPAAPTRCTAILPVRSAAAGGPSGGDTLAPPAPDTARFGRRMLRRRDRKLRKGLDRFDRLDAAKRHALRLQVKKQRYAAEFLARLFDRKAAGAYIGAAADLQDALGLANDRVVAARVVADIRTAAHPKGRLDWIAGVMTGWLVVRAQGSDEDDRVLRAACRRFRRAPRFWRRSAGEGDGESG